MAFGLGVGEAAPLEAETGDEILARAKLMIALAGGGLNPEELLAAEFGNSPHADKSTGWIA